MTPEIVTGKDGLAVAKKNLPRVVQELGEGPDALYDLIVPINFGEFIPFTRPTYYYSVREDETYNFILYCFYHYLDYSDANPAILQPLDEHRHDFEGALVIVTKKEPDLRMVVSVHHHDLKLMSFWTNIVLKRNLRACLFIESGGHGITPLFHLEKQPKPLLFYDNADLADWNAIQKEQLDYIAGKFNPKVKLPHQWNHWTVRRRYGAASDGLILTDPLKMLQLMQNVGHWDGR